MESNKHTMTLENIIHNLTLHLVKLEEELKEKDKVIFNLQHKMITNLFYEGNFLKKVTE